MGYPGLHPRPHAPSEEDSVHLPESVHTIFDGGMPARMKPKSRSNMKEPQMPDLNPFNTCRPEPVQPNTVSGEE